MVRTAQEQWLRWCVAACSGDDQSWPDQPPTLAADALLHTGLTALVYGEATRRGDVVGGVLGEYLASQHIEVEARYRRFEGLATTVLTALDEAKVVGIPVKGLALAEQAWPHPTERPMADLDLLIYPDDRARAIAALVAAGLTHHESNRHEETFLGWGDGSALPTEMMTSEAAGQAGESRHHNGKVELHPGWSEVFHGYAVCDDGQAMALAVPGRLGAAVCRRLPPGLLAAHALSHLSACVARRQVRAVNVIDLILVLRGLDIAQRALMTTFVATIDPRLSGPALWLVDAVAPDCLRQCGLAIDEHRQRWGEPIRRALEAATVESVLRSIDNRPPWAWRSAFTTTTRERVAMARQFVVPRVDELRGGNRNAPVGQLHVRRLTRASRRILGVGR